MRLLRILTLICLSLLSNSTFSSNEGSSRKIQASGDFRYRLENYSDELNNESRSRQRIRLRTKIGVKLNDTTSLRTRIVTSGGATSTNDTLGDSDSASSPLYLDQAYLNHNFKDLSINLGRMSNQFFKAGKNQLIWDGDLNFEGLHTSYNLESLYFNLGSFWIKEIEENDSDVTLQSIQVGLRTEFSKLQINTGFSNYRYLNSHKAGYSAYDGKGSLLSSEGMNIVEAYIQLKYTYIYPITIFASAAKNYEAQNDNRAQLIGFRIGSAKRKGDWLFGCNHRTVELNALEGRFMDSDHAGQTTDNKGDLYYVKYMLTDIDILSLGIFRNTTNANKKLMPKKSSGKYKKLHIDYAIKF